jgi:hypothetical protein
VGREKSSKGESMNDIPAFPVTSDFVNSKSAGMTLRDYFAAKAMQAILSEEPDYHTNYQFLDLADFSYQCADAMLKAREA